MTIQKDLTLVKASDGTRGFFIGNTLIVAEDPCGTPSVEMVAKNTAEALSFPLKTLELAVDTLDEWDHDEMLELAKTQSN